jgi:hypothetical protein
MQPVWDSPAHLALSGALPLIRGFAIIQLQRTTGSWIVEK